MNLGNIRISSNTLVIDCNYISRYNIQKHCKITISFTIGKEKSRLYQEIDSNTRKITKISANVMDEPVF
jgi:hypothetical protein